MKILIFLLTIFSIKSFAFDNPYLLRSPRGLLMGDAFTAVNDDSMAQFYNPASLGRKRADFELHPFNPQFNLPNVLNDMDRFSEFPDEPVAASEVLMDYPVTAGAGIAPGFKLFNVGVTFLASESYDLLLRNQAHPMLDVDLRSDKGILIGVGIPIGPSRLSSRSSSGSQTNFGIGAKYLERTGVRDTISFSGPTSLECLSQDDVGEVTKCLGKTRGIGWGFDAGFEHIIKNGNTKVVMGLAALDITDTKFEETKTADKLQVSDIRNQVNLGIAAGQDFNLFHYIISADVRALNEEMDFGKRLRLGAEVGIPGISFLAGVNSGYYSYGAMLNFKIMKLTAGFYDLELGSQYKQIRSKRFVVYLSLFDFSFDA